MEWAERMNRALDYLEEHLEGDTDYREAAQLACCSLFHFQRVFSCLAGVPVSEYVRRRKMTLAALELQKGGAHVLDLSLRYGYQSPTAFNRAFQSVHGVSPSEAKRQGAALRAYPPLHFQFVVKGVEKMEYRMEKKDAFRVCGFRMSMQDGEELNFSEVPKFWEKLARNGLLNRLTAGGNSGLRGLMGICSCCGPKEDWNYYIAALREGPVEEGMETYEVPASLWAVFPGEGALPDAVQRLEKRIVAEWLPASGYEYGGGPDVEYYLGDSTEGAKFEVWVPVAEK